VNSYPSQNHFELFTWYFTCDQIAFWNADDGFTALVANVNMWRACDAVGYPDKTSTPKFHKTY
jgi:hypothetical protein